MRGANPVLRVGDVLLDTSSRQTVKVLRLIGNRRVEVLDLRSGSVAKIVESEPFMRGITSGKVYRVSSAVGES